MNDASTIRQIPTKASVKINKTSLMTSGKLGLHGDRFRLGGGGIIGGIESLIGMNYFLRLNAVMTKPTMVNNRPGSPKKIIIRKPLIPSPSFPGRPP